MSMSMLRLRCTTLHVVYFFFAVRSHLRYYYSSEFSLDLLGSKEIKKRVEPTRRVEYYQSTSSTAIGTDMGYRDGLFLEGGVLRKTNVCSLCIYR